MSWSATAAFYDQLRRYVQAGFSIGQALEQLSDEAQGPYKIWAGDWARACLGGEALAPQLPDQYPLAKALIYAGEKSGHLPEACERISAFYQLCHEQKRSLIARSLYPVFLIHFATIVPVGAFSMAGFLPPWAAAVGPTLFWLTVIIIFVAYKLLKDNATFHRWCLKFPIGVVNGPLQGTMLCHVWESCCQAGLQYPEALRQGAQVSGNKYIQAILEKGATEIEQSNGVQFADVVQRLPLHKSTRDLCESGERSGTLEDALRRAGGFEKERFESALKWATKIINGTIYGIAMLVAVIVILSAASGYVGFLDGIKGPLGFFL